MPNTINKDRNKKEQIDVVQAKHQALILAQQIERRQRLKQLIEGNHECVTEGVVGDAVIEGERFGSPEHRVRSS